MDPSHDERPLQSEAEAQSEETVMPWIYGVLGLVMIVGFVSWVVFSEPQGGPRQPAAAAPLSKPIGQHY